MEKIGTPEIVAQKASMGVVMSFSGALGKV